ncbi:MAG: YkgJ family cysteine cluster protein [Candidatus Heimdallarchaeota archaeon]
MKRFQCRQCGSCCELIPSLFEVSKQGEMRRLYQHVHEHHGGLLWKKIPIQTFSEFLYYVRDFSSAEEQLGIENPGCPFLLRNGSLGKCLVHKAKPTGCKTFPESRKIAYELTLDCRGWD